MLRVTIEEIPQGDVHRAEVLDVFLISNQGATSDAELGDPGGRRWYKVRHLQPVHTHSGTIEREVMSIAHFRRDGRLRLIRHALEFFKEAY